MDYKKLREEPLKSSIREDFFDKYKYTQLGNIDFVIAKHMVENMQQSLFEEFENDDLKSILWAEAKPGTSHDIYESFVQLILTIGKERTFDKYLPPKYIGAFDAEKFAFIEYHEIQSIFYQNDFNWNVAPSNHDTKEFRQLYNLCRTLLEDNSIIFNYDTQAHELKEFIRLNFKIGKEMTEKISVTKNNFTFVFQKWSEKVRPTINVDWAKANKAGIISADFFLADLLSSNEESLKDSLYVVLRKTKYELAKKIDALGLISTSTVGFTDKQKAYKQFWSIYARPPKEEYWSYIIGRRDLLVPQDIRERKGSYFTPQIWVEKSQQYLADVLGEAWQEEYYIWDCCAGTGNLLNGLTNYDRVWASTLDKQDVDVMLDRINNGWAMAENHVFQFDFLNDEFTKCPEELQEILNDPKKRHKLVIYINPPYAEAGNKKQITDGGSNKSGVSFDNKIYAKWHDALGTAARELFVEFLIRVYTELDGCILAQFSKLKAFCAPNFSKFREVFKAELKSLFVVPANTFDNVKGQFPIGFFVWDTSKERDQSQMSIDADVFNSEGTLTGQHTYMSYNTNQLMLNWIRGFYDKEEEHIAYVRVNGQDVQNNMGLFLTCALTPNDLRAHFFFNVTKNNVMPMCVYLAVRHSVEATWLNDRDQFLYPNDGWSKDKVFQTDCLIYTLFHGQNRISSQQGVNHWIPFTREQVGCKKTFKSNFMNEFLKGKKLSPEAQAVYDAGLSLWRYYHGQPNANANASFYDIRRHFQGETNGRMNNDSDDETYTALIADLRDKMKLLARHIEPKVYDYGFLK
ncbi:MAG: hypothetical protein IKR33_09105 [Bacteroidales bacterium]|nr:hypothetical protein [Bacteroidales bacterium]